MLVINCNILNNLLKLIGITGNNNCVLQIKETDDNLIIFSRLIYSPDGDLIFYTSYSLNNYEEEYGQLYNSIYIDDSNYIDKLFMITNYFPNDNIKIESEENKILIHTSNIELVFISNDNFIVEPNIDTNASCKVYLEKFIKMIDIVSPNISVNTIISFYNNNRSLTIKINSMLDTFIAKIENMDTDMDLGTEEITIINKNITILLEQLKIMYGRGIKYIFLYLDKTLPFVVEYGPIRIYVPHT